MKVINRYTIKEGKYAGQEVKVLAPDLPTWQERMLIWDGSNTMADPVASIPQLANYGSNDFNLPNNGTIYHGNQRRN